MYDKLLATLNNLKQFYRKPKRELCFRIFAEEGQSRLADSRAGTCTETCYAALCCLTGEQGGVADCYDRYA